MECKICHIPLNVPVEDVRGFLAQYRDMPAGGGIKRDGPYCPPCLDGSWLKDVSINAQPTRG